MRERTIKIKGAHRSLSREDQGGQDVSMKEALFRQTTLYISQNQDANLAFYYILEVIECLSFLWFSIHPALNIYHQDSIILHYLWLSTFYLQIVLKIINFYEYLPDNPEDYAIMVSLATGFIFIISALWIWVTWAQKKGKINKFVRKVVNWMFVIHAKVLAGPFLGLSINVLYCDSGNPYHIGQKCYSPKHIVFCFLAFLVLLGTVFQICYFSLIYIIKNPFSGSCFACPNRYYFLPKSLFKILLPLYFALHSILEVDFLFLIAMPLLWVGYIILFRLFSLRTYNHQHFYVEFFLEGFLFWMALSSSFSYFFHGVPNANSFALIYALLCSLLMGVVLVNIDKRIYNSFMEECLEGKVKKQNLEKCLLMLINTLIHNTKAEHKGVQFHVYSSIWRRLEEKGKVARPKKMKSGHQQDENMKEIYQFLLDLVSKYLQDNSRFLFKYIKCILLKRLGFEYFSLHQVLELKQQKNLFTNEFAIYHFLLGFKDMTDSFNRQRVGLVKMYKYQQKFNYLNELMEQCAQNNREYWQQLTETNLSLPKLRNLATQYVRSSAQISSIYSQTIDLYPQSITPTIHYLYFLLQVGIDIRETIKVGEHFKTSMAAKDDDSLSSVVVSGDEFNSGDEVCMVVTDTVSSKLGHILNCNAQTKDLLGYSKESIIGKNLIKLMPKVYSELHNSFIINFLKRVREDFTSPFSTQDEQVGMISKSQRDVVALSSDNLLVRIGLSLQVVPYYDSLHIVGFMRKKEGHCCGLLMVQMTTGQILGIDEKFSSLMKKKLTGKQVIQEEPNMMILFPQFRVEEMEEKGYQELQLELGLTTDPHSGQETTVSTKVTLKEVRPYNGHRLGFLEVQEIRRIRQRELLQTNQKKKISGRASRASLRGKVIENQHMAQVKSEMKLEDILATEIAGEIGGKGRENINHFVHLARRINEFIEDKQKFDFGRYLGFFYCVSFVLVTSFLAFILFFSGNYLSKAEYHYSQMHLLSEIPYEEAKINLYTNRMWCLIDRWFIGTEYLEFVPNLKMSTEALTANYIQIASTLHEADFPMISNNKKYALHIQKAINESFIDSSLFFSHEEGINSYIVAAKTLYDPILAETMTPDATVYLQQSAYYISKNGDSILPNIATELAQSYFSQTLSSNFVIVVLCKCGFILLGVIIELGFYCLTLKAKLIEKQTIQIYQSIKLWDVHELSGKTHNYLNKRKTIPKKHIRTSLLDVFPVKTFLEIIDKKQGKLEKTSRRNGNALRQTETRGPNNEIEIEATEENLLLSKEEPCIKISSEYQDNKKSSLFIIIIIASLILLCLLSASIYFQFKANQELYKQFDLLKNVGLVRKTMTYLNLFAFNVAKTHNDPSYISLVTSTAAEFYKVSSLTYPQLGNPIFKTIYGQVETLEYYFGRVTNLDPTFRLDIYEKIFAKIEAACRTIEQMVDQTFKPIFESTAADSNKIEIIFISAIWIIGLLFSLVIYCQFITPLVLHRNQSINMLKMLPAWIVQRNQLAYQQIAK